jgi:hypothetical protein
MTYEYPADEKRYRNGYARAEDYAEAIDRGLRQITKEDKVRFSTLRKKLQREGWPDCKHDPAWWQRDNAGRYGVATEDGGKPVFREFWWDEKHYTHAITRPLAQYWATVLAVGEE